MENKNTNNLHFVKCTVTHRAGKINFDNEFSVIRKQEINRANK